jgi:hypothetical protein
MTNQTNKDKRASTSSHGRTLLGLGVPFSTTSIKEEDSQIDETPSPTRERAGSLSLAGPQGASGRPLFAIKKMPMEQLQIITESSHSEFSKT